MSEIAVIKGNDVRDKKLADSTAQTEVASTDGIRMVTTTGKEVYIARDSFANEVMKVINENVKTTVDGVFGVSGNEFGKITPANLATIIVGEHLPQSTDIDYPLAGISKIIVPSGSLPSGFAGLRGISFRNSLNDLTCFQICVAFKGGIGAAGIFGRICWNVDTPTWTSWKEL